MSRRTWATVAVAVVGVVFILSWIVRLWNEPASQGWVVMMIALIGLSKIAVDALWPDSPTNHSGATGQVDQSSWTCVQCGATGEAVEVEDATRAAGYRRVADLAPRSGSITSPSRPRVDHGHGGIARVRWEAP